MEREAGGQPAGQPSQWAALTVQRDGGGVAAGSSDGQQQLDSDPESDSEGSTGWARSAAPPSTTATGRSRRRRQEVGPQDVQRLVASKRQVRHVSGPTFLHAMSHLTPNTMSSRARSANGMLQLIWVPIWCRAQLGGM